MRLISDVYAGRSFSFLNRIVAPRQEYLLEDYFAAAESVLAEIVVALVAIALLLFAFAIYSWLASSKPERRGRSVDRFDKMIFTLGILVSMAMVLWFDDLYHSSDIEIFLDWRESLSQSLTNIYIGCESCNYPIIGTLFSAGVLNSLWFLFPTLDPESVAFALTHPGIRIPAECAYYSTNEGNNKVLDKPTQKAITLLRDKYSQRYVGSLVADFHRNLLKGGIFAYPADQNRKDGRLRLMYEANPLGFVAEQAGGAASTGYERILDIVPKELHQRAPLILGNKDVVEDTVAVIKGG